MPGMGALRTLVLVAALGVLLSGAPSTLPLRASAPMKSASAAAPDASQDSETAAEARDRAAAERNAEDLRRAQEVLTDLKARYTGLEGVTVQMGETPKNEQAVAYYEDGEIVISPTHTASITDILAHEVWHVIDWRDNGRIDWGESLPPSNSTDYLASETSVQ